MGARARAADLNIDSLYLNSARPYRRPDIFNAGIGRDNEKRNGEIERIGCGSQPKERNEGVVGWEKEREAGNGYIG